MFLVCSPKSRQYNLHCISDNKQLSPLHCNIMHLLLTITYRLSLATCNCVAINRIEYRKNSITRAQDCVPMYTLTNYSTLSASTCIVFLTSPPQRIVIVLSCLISCLDFSPKISDISLLTIQRTCVNFSRQYIIS